MTLPTSSANTFALDSRQLRPPDRFDGAETGWQDWSFQFEAYVGAIRLFTPSELELAAHSDQELRLESFTADTRARAGSLWYVLAQSLAGKALKLMRKCEAGNGLEAWRQLHHRFEEQHGEMKVGLLHQLISFKFGETLDKFLDSLTAFDLLLTKYNSQAEELPSDVCKSLLIQGAPEPLRTHLQVADPGLSFQSLRGIVENYVKQKHAWKSETSEAEKQALIYFMKGKGKGLCKGCDKGKGKDNGPAGKPSNSSAADSSRPTTSFEVDWSIQCWCCYGWGHRERQCPSKGHGKGLGCLVQEEQEEQEQFNLYDILPGFVETLPETEVPDARVSQPETEVPDARVSQQFQNMSEAQRVRDSEEEEQSETAEVRDNVLERLGQRRLEQPPEIEADEDSDELFREMFHEQWIFFMGDEHFV